LPFVVNGASFSVFFVIVILTVVFGCYGDGYRLITLAVPWDQYGSSPGTFIPATLNPGHTNSSLIVFCYCHHHCHFISLEAMVVGLFQKGGSLQFR
jgi:hypothetical protein